MCATNWVLGGDGIGDGTKFWVQREPKIASRWILNGFKTVGSSKLS